MRKQLLGATAVLLGAASIGLAVPAAPSHASAWKTLDKIPFPAGIVQDVEVVSTGDGDAVAAAIISGAVHAYTATDGAWSDHALVRVDVNAEQLVLATDEAGDTAVGWLEMVNGDKRLKVARQTSPTSWVAAAAPMTPAGADVTATPELGITGSGRVIVAATIDDGADIDQRLIVNEWAKGGQPDTPKVLSTTDASNPTLDVNSKGEALVAYNFTGLINNVLTVHRRSANGTWNIGDSTSNSGNIASAPDVAISENGQGQVIYSVVSNNFYRVETSRVLPTGEALNAELVEVSDDLTSEPSVDMNSSGSALFAWISKKDGVTSVRWAAATNGAYPGAAAALPGTLADAEAPIARVGEGTLRVIQHRGNGRITTHQRNVTAAATPFVGTTTPAGFGADSEADVDNHGNAVMAGFTADGTFARFFDGNGPDVTMIKPDKSAIAGTSVVASWSASDSLSPLQQTTDLYMTTARWNQPGHGDPKLIRDNLIGTATSQDVLAGATYCFQAWIVDTANNGGGSDKKCISVPLDDTSLAGSGWSRSSKTDVFQNTWSTTSTKGRTLTRSGVQAKQLSLVASKLPTGGTVRVSWGNTTLKTISLKGTAANKVIIPIVTWAGLHTGTVKITVVSESGKSVRIDGLVVAK